MSQSYSVRSGDSLSAIAQRFNTTVQKLASANRIKDPDHIQVGQKLVIPDRFEQKPAAGSARSYTVRSGDTLGEIAKKYGTSVGALRRLNPRIPNSNIIHPGQKVRVK